MAITQCVWECKMFAILSFCMSLGLNIFLFFRVLWFIYVCSWIEKLGLEVSFLRYHTLKVRGARFCEVRYEWESFLSRFLSFLLCCSCTLLRFILANLVKILLILWGTSFFSPYLSRGLSWSCHESWPSCHDHAMNHGHHAMILARTCYDWPWIMA